MLIDQRHHVEHAVDRRLKRAGKLGHHHVGEAAVAAEDHRRALLLDHAHHIAEVASTFSEFLPI